MSDFLVTDGHIGLVIGDIYQNRAVIPLGFLLMQCVLDNTPVKLRGIIVKNIAGNVRANAPNLWRWRALKYGYYTFKHEYIFVFKKEQLRQKPGRKSTKQVDNLGIMNIPLIG